MARGPEEIVEKQYETLRGYMDALDASLQWSFDAGKRSAPLTFSLYLTPKGNQYLVAQSKGNHPWIEIYQPVDTSNRWDTMFEKMQKREEETR